MNPLSPLSVSSPPKFTLKWTLTESDVAKHPATKMSPQIEMEIANTKHPANLVLRNWQNLIQIILQPAQKIYFPDKLKATLFFRYGSNEARFDSLEVRLVKSSLWIEMTRLTFTTVTNHYKDPFEVELQLHVQPPVVPTRSTLNTEPATQPPPLIWQLNEVRQLPLIKESPLFDIHIDEKKHQILFAMETNNDRIQFRIATFLSDYKQFGQSIKDASLVIQPVGNRSPIKVENLKVIKVISELVYLSTIKLSFAEITENYTIPLRLTIQLTFEVVSNWKYFPIGMHVPPFVFEWKVNNFENQPSMKTSSWVPLRMLPNLSPTKISFWLKHQTNEPIQLGLQTDGDQEDVALCIDRVTIHVTDSNGLKTELSRIASQLIGDCIYFDLEDNHFSFAQLTNEYTKPFGIHFRLHPAAPSDDYLTPIVELKAKSLNQSMVNLSVKDKETPQIRSLFAPNRQTSELLRQLNTLLVDQIDCDIHFECQGGTRIGAHRFILQTRSAFFKQLLLQPKDDHRFQLIDAQTMADALQFIYTGTAPQIADTAERLLSVARLMDLPELVELAQQQLIRKQSIDRNPTFSRLFDLFDSKDDPTDVAQFVYNHLDELLASSQFVQQLKQHPAVCCGLILLMHESIQN